MIRRKKSLNGGGGGDEGKEWSPLFIKTFGQSVSLWCEGGRPEIDGEIRES